MRLTRSSTFLCAALLVSGASAFAQTSNWDIDPVHSNVQFTVRHMAISNVTGNFHKLSGTVDFNEPDVTQSRINATIDTASVDTREEKRDGHLKSQDFFDVAKYPTITFKSKRIVQSGGQLQMIGDLTIRGVTKEVALDVDAPTKEVTDPYGMVRRGFSASTKIHRQDYGLVWSGMSKAGEAVVGDDIRIALDVELVKKAARAGTAATN
jgi:polyisoprenoid-binding protein YceI